MAKRSPKSIARDRAWKACSLYIRTRDSDGVGNCRCVSCQAVQRLQETDAGHFMPRSKSAFWYYDERNIHAQCAKCNRFDPESAKIRYTRFMLATYGEAFLDELEAKKREPVKDTLGRYREIEAHYKEKLAELAA